MPDDDETLRDDLALAGWCLLATALVFGCARPRDVPPRQEAPPPFVLRAPPLAPPSAMASSSPGDASAVDAARAPSAPSLRCGTQACQAGTEICCTVVQDAPGLPVLRTACVAKVPVDDLDRTYPFLVCARALPAVGLTQKSVGRECDDSSDCGDGALCCEQTYGSGEPTQIMCVPPAPGKRFTCEFEEQCSPGASCRTPRTTCSQGQCVSTDSRSATAPAARLACGGRVCPDTAPTCCATGATPSCTAASACGPGDDVSCTRGAECEDGEFCAVVPLGGSFCTHRDDGMVAAACADATDCVVFCEGRGKPRCEGSGWRPTCRCDP
jgi:hypothetical protein